MPSMRSDQTKRFRDVGRHMRGRHPTALIIARMSVTVVFVSRVLLVGFRNVQSGFPDTGFRPLSFVLTLILHFGLSGGQIRCLFACDSELELSQLWWLLPGAPDRDYRRRETSNRAVNWTAADGIASDQPLIVSHGRGRYRLAHQADGACVFLNEQGLCRIHAKFGEPAKPLACRVYPYAFHPVDRSLTVSLRFSCPSVVQNLGARVADQKGDLEQLAALVTATSRKEFEPPQFMESSD